RAWRHATRRLARPVHFGRGGYLMGRRGAILAGSTAVIVAAGSSIAILPGRLRTPKPVAALLTSSAPAGATPSAVASPAAGALRPAPSAALGAVALTGCPPPPRKPGPPAHPWHPAVLVPDTALPVPPRPSPRI